MKQATLSFIASQLLNKTEKDHLEKIFKALDTDGNGCLSKKEILDGWERHVGGGMTEYEIEQMFDRIDTDKSGEIDYSEFVMATINEKNLLTKEKLQAAFNMFDRVGPQTHPRIKAGLSRTTRSRRCWARATSTTRPTSRL